MAVQYGLAIGVIILVQRVDRQKVRAAPHLWTAGAPKWTAGAPKWTAGAPKWTAGAPKGGAGCHGPGMLAQRPGWPLSPRAPSRPRSCRPRTMASGPRVP